MRTIKFRAWDKSKNRYLKSIETSDIVLRLLSGRITQGSINRDDIVLQQYTGLLDRNGKEIYEGDLLRSESTELTKVEFIEGMWVNNVLDRDKRNQFNVNPSLYLSCSNLEIFEDAC